MDSIDTSLELINFVNDVAKLRHIEFDLGQASAIKIPTSYKIKQNPTPDILCVVYGIHFTDLEYQLLHGPTIYSLAHNPKIKWAKEDGLQKHFEKTFKDLWLHRNDDKQISYWDKNYWIHPDERCESVIQRPVIKRRKGRGRRIRERTDMIRRDTVQYLKEEDYTCPNDYSSFDCDLQGFHCHKCPWKQFHCHKGACTIEKCHVHFDHIERVFHPAETVHEYEYEEQNDTIIETRDTYDFVDGFYHTVSIPREKLSTRESTHVEKEERK